MNHILKIFEPETYAGIWNVSTVFMLADDLMLMQVIEARNVIGGSASQISVSDQVALRSRHVGRSFADFNHYPIWAYVYLVDSECANKLQHYTSGEKAMMSGLLNNSIGIAELDFKPSEVRE